MALSRGKSPAAVTAEQPGAGSTELIAFPATGPIGLLQSEPYRFDFFQAVRVLQAATIWAGNRADIALGDEPVRLAAHQSLAFPPSDVCEFIPPQAPQQVPKLVVAVFGLTGPAGALPIWYTDYVLTRLRQKDGTLRDFLDIFNHRLLMLFYRAWEKYRFFICYERAEHGATTKRAEGPLVYRAFLTAERSKIDLFSDVLLHVSGLGTPALRYRATVGDDLTPRSGVADEALRFYAGLLAQQHRTASGLQALLHDYFGVPVEILQFYGQWLRLDAENQSQLSAARSPQLGRNMVIGERIRDLEGKIRIRLGPLTYEQYLTFMPGTPAHRSLSKLARLYVGMQFDVDVQLVLRAAEVPATQLASGTDFGPRLGWNTWSLTAPAVHDTGDGVFPLSA